ncbi:CVNH domain-containing protein, partial [Klebsiella pneumoniae]|nr:CVNH domain-containing protein [Klebsiella pneumoniae]
MVAGWLNATCQDRSGRWVQATTVPSRCASGNDIANEDGRLVCKSGGVGAAPSTGAFGAERPPAGSYMAT